MSEGALLSPAQNSVSFGLIKSLSRYRTNKLVTLSLSLKRQFWQKKEKKKKKPAHLDLHKLLFFVLVVLPPFYDANVTYIKIFSCVLIFICFYDRNHHNNSSISVFTLNVRTQDKLDT